MSVMIELCGSFGSSSPKARPAIVSYIPAEPKEAPLKAGETLVSTTIFLILACADSARDSVRAQAKVIRDIVCVAYRARHMLYSFTRDPAERRTDRVRTHFGYARKYCRSR